MVDPRTPVLVGAGVAHQRSDDPRESDEALSLMTTAVERAGEDAHAPSLLAQAGVVFVPRGTWRYRDPGRIVAERVGANARTVVAELGVLQSTPFTRACRAIANGDLDVAIVVGGEAKFRDLRSHITGTAVADTGQDDDVVPDESIVPADEIIPAPERAAGFMSAPLMYSAVETALRTALGETVTENAHATAELWAGFSRTAAANPDAWRREPVSPEFLEHPSAKNPMLAAPYTKWHCSQWNVDQAAGFVLCSTEAADRAGVPQDRRVYPLAAVESNHMLAVSKRAELHRAPAVRIGAERIAGLTGIDVAACDLVDLYSCFPVAVRIQARELGLPLDDPDGRPLSVGGGMTFGGGPLNNATFQALARMVAMLRDAPGSTGLLTFISGIITKHGESVWSTAPPERDGFAFADTSTEVETGTPALEVVGDHRGVATIDAYTVAHEGGDPRYTTIVATTPARTRVVARNDDPDLAADMTVDEWCGRDVRVDGDRFSVGD
ncbi:MAG TPA: acetyl-CoA acetyltransferase [Acidimicrobiia bacterium]|nr:acetyl-CoA acetyltransferase [Acidimicrobiia bacterium]